MDSSGRFGEVTIISSPRGITQRRIYSCAAFERCVHNLDRYDLGFWSLYEQSGTRLPMVASRFYHQLHIVQLRIMHRLTGEVKFAPRRRPLGGLRRSRSNRTRALCYKSAFKLCYY